MRALIISDIHGSVEAAEKALDHFESLKCDEIWILGDVGMISSFNDYKNLITAVRGNCDTDYSAMALDFPVEEDYQVIERDGLNFFLTHGHLFSADYFSKDEMKFIDPLGDHRDISAFLCGHSHIWRIERNRKGVLVVNPGSLSRPRGGTVPSFALYETNGDGRGTFSIRELKSGKILKSATI